MKTWTDGWTDGRKGCDVGEELIGFIAVVSGVRPCSFTAAPQQRRLHKSHSHYPAN